MLFAAALIVMVALPALALGFFLNGAELTVYPKSREPNVNGTFTAYSEPGAGELSFETMTLEATGERQLAATGEEEVSEQATGEIIVMNTSDSSERLIKNTRFETPDGLIFRATESIVVPAGTEEDPGTVRAQVFADEAGEEYNIDPTTFVVPGYREGGYDALYEAITARSETPMQGGFDGITYTVDDDELEVAQASLHEELRSALMDRVANERPAGFVLFDNSLAFTTESLPTVESGEDMVTIKEKVLLHAPIFEDDALAAFVAAATIPGYEEESVRIEDTDALTFAYAATSTASTDLRNLDSFEFKLSGQPQIVWTFDEAQLREDLAGAQKTALQTVLGGYPAIERAEAVIRPFWKRSFPENPDAIDIVESLDRGE